MTQISAASAVRPAGRIYDIVKRRFSRRFGALRDDLVKTSLSGKYKAHVWASVGSGRVSVSGRVTVPCMSFAENDQAHKGF